MGLVIRLFSSSFEICCDLFLNVFTKISKKDDQETIMSMRIFTLIIYGVYKVFKRLRLKIGIIKELDGIVFSSF